MKLISAIIQLLKESIAAPTRYLRAVASYPHTTFHPGVRVGHGCIFGSNVTVLTNATVANSNVGCHTYIGANSVVKHCRIGRFCSIGPRVRIGLGIHPTDRVSTYPGFYSPVASGATKFHTDLQVNEYRPVSVGNDVWIGEGALIMDGVTVGDGAVIAAGAVVTADVAPFSIIGGVPAKFIRSRFDAETVSFLLDLKWWNMDDAQIRTYASSFINPDTLRLAIGVNG